MRQDESIPPNLIVDEFCTNKAAALDGLFVSQFIAEFIAPRLQRNDIRELWENM